ncbi:Uma2 family endonuclease [Baaleninema simplex]|uniref:Uma2 family endonuclease n=1 Tax=Baaleninema simplex TaxID=2862350 RepID=UPI00034D61F5|nr:Uma2 family endonuclease [Baaleninema simplex]
MTELNLLASQPSPPNYPSLYRFDVRAYRQLAETGVVAADDRLELIQGTILRMSPIGTKHQACVALLNRLFVRQLGDRAVVWPQNAIELSDRSQPQPDLALLKPREDFYSDRYPTPDDTVLVVEIADSTVSFDRDVKMPLYASAGIREMWLVDLMRGCVEVYREPSDVGYQMKRTASLDAEIAPATFPDCRLAVAEFVRVSGRSSS